MSYDPRQTMFVIESVDAVLREWTTVFSLAEEQTRESIVAGVQSVETFAGRTRGLLAETEGYLQLAGEVSEVAAQVRSEVLACKASADRTTSAAHSASAQASSLIGAWQSALERAGAHLADTQGRLNAAYQGLSSAESVYASARIDYEAAEMSLRYCQNSYVTDSKGRQITPNCSGEHVRAIAAQSRLSTAHGAVVEWQGRVSHWVGQQELAQGVVENRRAGLARASHARRLADNALDAAAAADRHARDGQLWSDSAASGAAQMERLASDVQSSAEAAVALGRSAQDQAVSMERGGSRVADAVSDHRNHAGRAGLLLADAFDALREFDRPGGL